MFSLYIALLHCEALSGFCWPRASWNMPELTLVSIVLSRRGRPVGSRNKGPSKKRQATQEAAAMQLPQAPQPTAQPGESTCLLEQSALGRRAGAKQTHKGDYPGVEQYGFPAGVAATATAAPLPQEAAQEQVTESQADAGGQPTELAHTASDVTVQAVAGLPAPADGERKAYRPRMVCLCYAIAPAYFRWSHVTAKDMAPPLLDCSNIQLLKSPSAWSTHILNLGLAKSTVSQGSLNPQAHRQQTL